MKSFKKILAFVLAASSIALCACNTEPSNTETPAESTTPALTTPSALPSTTPAQSAIASPTATSTPTPTPDPTVSFYESVSNYKQNTEEGIDVLPVGKYKITFSDGTVLSYDGTAITTNGENFDFSLQFQNSGKDSSGKVKYMFIPGDTLVQAVAVSGNSAKITTLNDRSNSQLWRLEKNDDGTYMIYTDYGTTKYLCLSKEDGKIYLKPKDTEGFEYNIKLDLISAGNATWDQYISEKGNIILRVNKNIYKMSMLDKERFEKLVNDLQSLYETYQDLTSFTPYESIVVKIYQEEKYFAYVVGGWNTINFNFMDAVADLKRMGQRTKLYEANDWNFCLMHEMGHMFDLNRGWRFDGESATNIKVAYALWANLDKKAVAAQSGYSYKQYFDGNTISETWKSEPPMTLTDGKTLGEKVSRTCYIFSTYALNEIGWEAFRSAYHEINALNSQPTDVNVRLKIFTDALAKHGGKHIKEYIGEDEWNVLVEKCKQS